MKEAGIPVGIVLLSLWIMGVVLSSPQ